jgi:DNA-binding MarR family transcriptional regulator
MAASDAAWRAYERMRIQLAARISRELARESGLSDADLEVLMALACTPGGSLQALGLRCALGWEKSRLSHQLRRMEGRGLLARGVCSEDGRAAIVALTELGRGVVADATPSYRAAVQRWFTDVLSAQQQRDLEDISAAILAGLGPGAHTVHED